MKKNITLIIFLILCFFNIQQVNASSSMQFLKRKCVYSNGDKEFVVERTLTTNRNLSKNYYLSAIDIVDGGNNTDLFSNDDYKYNTQCPKSVEKPSVSNLLTLKTSTLENKYEYKLKSSQPSGKKLKENKCHYMNKEEGTQLTFITALKPHNNTNRYEFSVEFSTPDMSKKQYSLSGFDFINYYEYLATGNCYKEVLFNPPGGIGTKGMVFSDTKPSKPGAWATYYALTFESDDIGAEERDEEINTSIEDTYKLKQEQEEKTSRLNELESISDEDLTEDQRSEKENLTNEIKAGKEELEAMVRETLITCNAYRTLSNKTPEMDEICAKGLSDFQVWVENGVIRSFTSGCGMLGTEFKKWLQGFFDFIKVGSIVLLVIMGLLDFTKAVTSGKDDAIKTAWSSFTKRSLALVILFLLPVLLEFLLTTFGVYTDESVVKPEDSKLCDIK